MPRSLLASTMLRLDSNVWKNGHCLCIFCSNARRSFRSLASLPRKFSIAEPKPHHPGKATRHCPQAEAPRDRAQIFNCARSLMRGRTRTNVEISNFTDWRDTKKILGHPELVWVKFCLFFDLNPLRRNPASWALSSNAVSRNSCGQRRPLTAELHATPAPASRRGCCLTRNSGDLVKPA